MRGTKRKIKIAEIQEKSSKTVAFTKRKDGLFRKTTKLCLQNPLTRVAILVTPISANSHASFYSFGHTSVDDVVSSFLSGQPPPLPPINQETSSGSGFWWEDQSFDTSEDVDDLKEAVNAISTMLNNVRLRLDDAVATNQNDKTLVIHQDQDLLEEEVLQTTTNQVPILKGETSSDSPPSFLMNDEDIDQYIADLM